MHAIPVAVVGGDRYSSFSPRALRALVDLVGWFLFSGYHLNLNFRSAAQLCLVGLGTLPASLESIVERRLRI